MMNALATRPVPRRRIPNTDTCPIAKWVCRESKYGRAGGSAILPALGREVRGSLRAHHVPKHTNAGNVSIGAPETYLNPDVPKMDT